MKYTNEDLGKRIDYSDDSGSYYDERIVEVYCAICSARFLGPIRHAGGFIAGHEAFHAWEFKIAMNADDGMVV
tara:strand:+ start:387 stop:605 length:219 start_codon:yes stop_codon:yes gene_type:complete